MPPLSKVTYGKRKLIQINSTVKQKLAKVCQNYPYKDEMCHLTQCFLNCGNMKYFIQNYVFFFFCKLLSTDFNFFYLDI